MRIVLKNGKMIDITVKQVNKTYEYYLEGEKIGACTPGVMHDNILVLHNTLENELMSQIKETINKISRQEIENEVKENKAIDTYIRELGKRDYKVKEVRKIELGNKETDEKQSDVKVERVNKDKSKEKDASTTKDVNIKQEVSLNERANDMNDIKKWIGGKIPDDVQKIGIIYSEDMKNIKDEKGNAIRRNSTRYSLVTINKNGEIEPLAKYIPELKQRDAAGSNPTAEKYQVSADGKVEKDAVLSEYEFGKKIIQLDNKEMGRVEMNIGEEAHDSTKTMGVQVRDSNTTFATSTKTRATIGEYEKNGVYTVDENLEEAESHEQNGECTEMTVDDIDGDPNTKSHIHDENLDFNELAVKWGYYINGKPNAEKAKEILEKKANEETNKTKTQEEVIEMISEEMENDYRRQMDIA